MKYRKYGLELLLWENKEKVATINWTVKFKHSMETQKNSSGKNHNLLTIHHFKYASCSIILYIYKELQI